MALIRNAEPKSRSKGYDRLFDNCDLGYLIRSYLINSLFVLS